MCILLLTLVVATLGQSAPLSKLVGDTAALRIMELRQEFDKTELAAIREFDAAMGDAKGRIAVPTARAEAQDARANRK